MTEGEELWMWQFLVADGTVGDAEVEKMLEIQYLQKGDT